MFRSQPRRSCRSLSDLPFKAVGEAVKLVDQVLDPRVTGASARAVRRIVSGLRRRRGGRADRVERGVLASQVGG